MPRLVEVIAGLIAAVAVVGLGYATHQGRSLPFYSTVMIVIALAYVLFAVMAERPRTVLIESAVATVFIAAAVVAARWPSRRAAAGLLAVGLIAHGGYDLVHPLVVTNPVVPGWWPLFCGGVDVVLGGWVALASVGSGAAYRRSGHNTECAPYEPANRCAPR
jgi:hypothetical protein